MVYSVRVLAASLLGILAFSHAALAQTPAPDTTALEIYDKARAHVAARVLPPYIAYTTFAAIYRKGKTNATHQRIVLRTSDGHAYITPIPDSARDRIDTTPRASKRVDEIWPVSTFGFVPRKKAEHTSAFEAAPVPSAAPTDSTVEIGRVRAVARTYEPTLVGTESIDGASVYHLKLVPRFAPDRNPIRDMWIDTSTYDPRRIAIEVYARVAHVTFASHPIVYADYKRYDSVWMIDHLSVDFALRMLIVAFAGNAEYRTVDVTFPDSEPDWKFDADLLREHRAHPIADKSPTP